MDPALSWVWNMSEKQLSGMILMWLMLFGQQGLARWFSRVLSILFYEILGILFVRQCCVIPIDSLVIANGQGLCFTDGHSQHHFGTWGLMMLLEECQPLTHEPCRLQHLKLSLEVSRPRIQVNAPLEERRRFVVVWKPERDIIINKLISPAKADRQMERKSLSITCSLIFHTLWGSSLSAWASRVWQKSSFQSLCFPLSACRAHSDNRARCAMQGTLQWQRSLTRCPFKGDVWVAWKGAPGAGARVKLVEEGGLRSALCPTFLEASAVQALKRQGAAHPTSICVK